MTIEALKLALEALETNNKAWKHLADSGDAGFWEAEKQPFYEMSVKAITAIKEALAQPDPYAKGYADAMNWKVQNHLEHLPTAQQEPVVWMYQDKSTHEVRFQKHMRDFVDHGATYETPLYTTPPQRKPLDAGEISRLWKRHTSEDGPHHSPYDDDGLEFARAIEAKLKEKNT